MTVWMEHVKSVRKKCPNISFKEALTEAKKTYNKGTSSSKGEIVCPKKSNQPKISGRPKKSRRKSRGKSRGKSRRRTRGRSRGRSKSRRLKVSKKARCGVFGNGPGC